jgi:hypothetical protein
MLKRMRCLNLLAGAMLFAMSGSAQDPAFATGPSVGEKVPAFSAVDQDGKTQTLDSLMGPNGLLLLFHRSADW